MQNGLQLMSEPIYKKVQVVGTSPVSFSEAVAEAVKKLRETKKDMSWFEVVELRGAVSESKIAQYQVTVNIGCRIS